MGRKEERGLGGEGSREGGGEVMWVFWRWSRDVRRMLGWDF